MSLVRAQRIHPTAHTLGIPPREFAKRYQTDPELQGRWAEGYDQAKDGALATALGDAHLLKRFRSGKSLPRGYGFGLDERIVELPWVLANLSESRGPVLDAGSALNHRIVLQRIVPVVESLTIATFTQEDSHADLGPTYVTADLRDLPFTDGAFETIVCVSTLEHVGMDNSDYGSSEPPSDDPDREVSRALAEFHRVLRPGGRLLITLPYGHRENHGWCRQFDKAGIRRIAESFGEGRSTFRVYAYSLRGWHRSSLRRAADATYRDPKSDHRPQHDCAYAARAVACLTLTRAG
jgi:SAM-dependent methyltransferase